MTKLKSKTKIKKQPQNDAWTAKAWVGVCLELSNLAFNERHRLPKKQRDILYYLSELADETAARLSGYTPEMEAAYYAKCQAEDDAMVARRTPEQVAAAAAEVERQNAEYKANRRRPRTRVSAYSAKKEKPSTRPVQLKLKLA